VSGEPGGGPGGGLAGLSFHHFGLAVGQPDEASRYLRALGYQPGRQAFDERQRVNLAMWHHPAMPDVEVIWPGAEPSPVDKLVKRMGTLIYHLCYESPDCAAAIAAMEAAGLDVLPVSPPTPAVLFEGREVSFYTVSGFGLIELLAA
jgi:4-hydroxyphenylpyruvate dioxygenase-like putative hemolysin